MGAYVLTSSTLRNSLIELIQIDLPSFDVRRTLNRFSSIPHELEKGFHEELRIQLSNRLERLVSILGADVE